MQKSHPHLRPGSLVRARRRRWRVRDIVPFEACQAVRLDAREDRPDAPSRTLLTPFDRLAGIPDRDTPRRTSWRRLLARIGEAGALLAPADGLWTAARADIHLLAYQLEPALAVVRGHATRLLLADEVGLGKTVQAGIALRELAERGLADRVLVLTPAGLCQQWVEELGHRVGLEAELVDAASLRRTTAELPVGVNPWALPGVRVASIDYVKQPEVLQALDALAWDALVVDEAHGLGPSTDRGEAAGLLASQSRIVILATATPHDGSDRTFAALCDTGRLGGSPGEPPMAVFRRSRAEVGLAVSRRIHLLRIRPTAAERRMHALLSRYGREVWRESSARRDPRARLAIVVLEKRALSSARALLGSVSRRLEWLDGSADAGFAQLVLPLSEGDPDAEDAEPDAVLSAPGLADLERERAWLRAIQRSAVAACPAESKRAALRRFARRVQDPLLVFTEYRDTLVGLAEALGRPPEVEILHGALARHERRRAERSFTHGSARILLATDAAGEGLNLHRRCRVVINYELPWTPRRLEQRLGRIDRIGQARRVHAVHLMASGTAETAVLGRLAARLDQVRRAFGTADEILGLPADAIARAAVTGDIGGLPFAGGGGAEP